MLKVQDMVMLAQGNAMQHQFHVPGVDILAFNREHRCVFAVGISKYIHIFLGIIFLPVMWKSHDLCQVLHQRFVLHYVYLL